MKKIDSVSTIQKLNKEMGLTIALKNLKDKFTHDDRITDAFNNTIEAHAFNLVRDSIIYALSMSLMRIHDTSDRSDINSLRFLFEKLMPKAEAMRQFGERVKYFEEARNQYNKLKNSHLVSRIINLRHKFIAHHGDITMDVQLPKLKYLDDLTKQTCILIESLNKSITTEDLHDYEGIEISWNKCATIFFNSLITGQLLRKEKSMENVVNFMPVDKAS